jgi:predicted ABC-type transport system involved in lysophospholipase L1 biosynthesis ATPase subunit
LWDLARSHGHTFVIATHDMSLAGNADRVVHIYDGHIKNVKKADLRELFSF